MAWDGNGNFIRLYSWVADKANGINPSSSRFDNEDNGFASAGFGNCVTRDGQGKATAAQSPATTALYDLGTTLLNWRNLYLSGFAAIGGAQVGNFQETLIAGTSPGNSNGLYIKAGTNASDVGLTVVAATNQQLALIRGDGSGQLFYNGTVNTINVTAAGAIQAYGFQGAAYVDMSPDRATWTSVFSGPFTSNPNGGLTWERHGNHVEVFAANAITGTSTNSSNFITASALPAAITPSTARYAVAFGIATATVSPVLGLVTVNANGTLTIAPMGTGASSNTPVFFPSGGTTGVAAGFAFRYCL